MKNTKKKSIELKLFFLHVFSDDVFHIIFDNVSLKDSVQISRYFINFALWHPAQQTVASLERLVLSYFAFVLWSPSHEVLLIISGGKYVPRVFVWHPD